MSEPPASGPQTSGGPDETLISAPKAELPTQSSLNPQERTSSGETKTAGPGSEIVDVGSQLGPYHLVAKLGEGGMGAVYKARHARLDKLVALKILPRHVMSRPDAVARFDREMKAIGKLQHSNVVQAHDAGEFNGVHYLSMEYVEGQDLQELVKTKGPMSVVNACKAIRQAAQGLAAAHKMGLVHRDIKPSNLFVTKQAGQIKILDMGLALLAQEEVPAALTSTGQCFGTPDYMAPEQWNDAHTCDARADLYSLGCTLYYLLVGHPPYHSATHRTAANKMKGHVIDPIPDLHAARQDIPEGLDAIYRKLMAKAAEDRFASANELAEALAPFTSHKGAATPRGRESLAASESSSAVAVGHGGPRGRMIPQGGAPAATNPLSATSTWKPEPSTAAPPRSPGKRRLLVAGGAAALVMMLGVIIITIRQSLNVAGPELPKSVATTPSAPAGDAEKLPAKFTNRLGMEFVLVGKGTAWLGGGNGQQGEKKVEIPEDFYLGVYEVTQEEWEQVTGLKPSQFSRTGGRKDAVLGVPDRDLKHFPVDFVSWDDVQLFLARLNRREPEFGWVYRLPKEAEWEYACRGGPLADKLDSAFDFYFDKPTTALVAGDANFEHGKGLKRTCAVGSYKPNRLGLHDLHGNVVEWCDDSDHDADGGEHRVIRGGCWSHSPDFCSAKNRGTTLPSSHDFAISSLGLRVARVRVGPAMPKPVATTPSAPVSVKSGWHGWPADAPMPAIAPFDADQAQHHQEAWAKYLQIEVEYTNTIGMKFVLIPPGEFTMGSTAAEIDAAVKEVDPNDKHWQQGIKSEDPQHKVILTQPIYLGVNEVTQAEYEKVMGTNPSYFAATGMGKEAVDGMETTDHPVETVSWNDAAEFCTKLNKREKLKPFYFRAGETVTPLDGTGYRLPSEAEWEFACRAGTATKYWISDKDEDLVRAGWFCQNSGGRTHAAGELKAKNPFGLSDIHGNVEEWVQDAWDATYYSQFREKPATNPDSPFRAGSWRVFRGGYWLLTASSCRSSYRNGRDPSSRFLHIGFRVSLVAVGSPVSRP